jgi:hypothetical protein
VKWRVVGVCAAVFAAVVVVTYWVTHVRSVGSWLQVHTGTVNEGGVYYAFWSGFGSDLAELGIIGALATGLYHVVRRYNCHEPGCWRIGRHPAAGGQFSLCYHHHPDYQGRRPTHELIERMHREHAEQQAGVRHKLNDVYEHITREPPPPG